MIRPTTTRPEFTTTRGSRLSVLRTTSTSVDITPERVDMEVLLTAFCLELVAAHRPDSLLARLLVTCSPGQRRFPMGYQLTYSVRIYASLGYPVHRLKHGIVQITPLGSLSNCLIGQNVPTGRSGTGRLHFCTVHFALDDIRTTNSNQLHADRGSDLTGLAPCTGSSCSDLLFPGPLVDFPFRTAVIHPRRSGTVC